MIDVNFNNTMANVANWNVTRAKAHGVTARDAERFQANADRIRKTFGLPK